jgi:hypothetical protein
MVACKSFMLMISMNETDMDSVSKKKKKIQNLNHISIIFFYYRLKKLCKKSIMPI